MNRPMTDGDQFQRALRLARSNGDPADWPQYMPLRWRLSHSWYRWWYIYWPAVAVIVALLTAVLVLLAAR